MGRFAVMTMTDAPQGACATSWRQSDALGIRVGVKKGGCAGMEYDIELAHEAKPREDVIEHDGAKVFVAPEAVLYLLGTQMDFEQTALRTGFTFNNSNQTSACAAAKASS